MTPGARPRTPGPPSVPEEVRREDVNGRITALENLAVTHATFLQQIHDDVIGIRQALPQITDKIGSLDAYAQSVDKRLTGVRDEAEAQFRRTGQELYQRMGKVEEM